MDSVAHRSIYLVTTAGHPNYGDELIVHTWLRRLADNHPDAEVWIDSPNPGVAATLFCDDHPRVRCTDTLWQLCGRAPGESLSVLTRFISDHLSEPDTSMRLVPGITHLRRADVVHLIGGGFVNGIWRRNMGLLAALWWSARQPGVTTAITGAGLVPPGAPAGLLAELLANVDVVDVRDRASADLLLGVDHRSVTGDDALLDFRLPADPGDLPDTMVCLQGDLVAIDREELLAWTLRVLHHWGAHDEQIGFVECIPGVDRQAYDELSVYLPKVRLFTLWDLLEEGFPARPNQRWITTRFHPHLLAALSGASGVAVMIDPVYYRNKHESLFDFGTGWAAASDEEGALRDPITVEPARSPDLEALSSLAVAKRRLADRLYGPAKSTA